MNIVKHHKAKTYHLISPEGDNIKVTNLVQFAKEHGLCEFGIYRLASGRIKKHRGWKKNNNEDLFKQLMRSM